METRPYSVPFEGKTTKIRYRISTVNQATDMRGASELRKSMNLRLQTQNTKYRDNIATTTVLVDYSLQILVQQFSTL
jgi:hypothetical protein